MCPPIPKSNILTWQSKSHTVYSANCPHVCGELKSALGIRTKWSDSDFPSIINDRVDGITPIEFAHQL